MSSGSSGSYRGFPTKNNKIGNSDYNNKRINNKLNGQREKQQKGRKII